MLCSVYQLGQIGYRQAWELQQALLQERVNGNIGDSLLMVEHPPTITLGKSGRLENILVSGEELAKRGISFFFSDRGGDVTYHGPGQLVGYPIINLRDRGRDLHQYIHNLEEVVIRTLADFGIRATRDSAHRGVWVADREIAAIGLRVRKWVTMHGFALNVNTDLVPFSLINPCGFSDRGATSMAVVLAKEVAMIAVTERTLARFSEVFEVELELAPADTSAELVKKADFSALVRNNPDANQTTVLV